MKRKIFTNLVAFVFAFFAVIYSIFGIRFNHIVNYRINLVNIPKDITPSDKDINFSVEYSCSNILKGLFTKKEIEIDYDVSPSVRNTFFLNLDVSQFVKSVPFCSVVSYSPKVITVEFQRIISRYLKVYPDIVGNVPENYVYSFSVSPPYVMVRGPESKVRDKDGIYTEIIDIQDRISDFSIRIPLRKEPDIETNPDFVYVFFKIMPK